MTLKPVLIFGTSDLARSVDLCLTHDSTRTVAGFCATAQALENKPIATLHDKPVLTFDSIETTHPPDRFDMFVAVGYAQMNARREAFMQAALAKGYHLISHLCSSVTRWPDLKLGRNVFVFENNLLQHDVTIGDGVIIGRANSIGHDSVIEDYAFLANRSVLCGHNHVGTGSFIGSNATIMDGVTLARRTLVGAAAFVKRDTQEGDVFVTPATPKSPKRSSEFFEW